MCVLRHPFAGAAAARALVLAGAALLLPGWASASSHLSEPMAPERFQACVQALGQQTGTALRPLARDDFLRIAGQAQYDDRVRQSMRVQVTEPTFWWDDIAATTDDERVAQGREVLARQADALARIEQRFGVPREIVVAIYGIETNYGTVPGRIPVLDAAMTLACLRPCPPGTARCASRERAYAAVRLLRDGRVRPESFQGSWAAAFGRTQFVPDSFEQLAVDLDGDGVADIVGSEPDALASAANHLARRGGWTREAPPYIEVRVPAGQEAAYRQPTGASAAASWRPASAWANEGWRAVGPTGEPGPLPVPAGTELRVFAPVGLPGPVFLASRNFQSLWRYNNSDRYVMQVAVLAHRLAGGPGIVTPWPTDDPGLSRAQVRELQAWLLQRGHALVTPDGVMGRNTRDAIEAERARAGLPPGRRVGQRTMVLLMRQ